MSRRIGEEAPKVVEVTRDFIIYWMEKFRDSDASDPNAGKALLKTFVSTVRLYDSKEYFEIEYNYTGKQGKKHLEKCPQEGFAEIENGGMYGT